MRVEGLAVAVRESSPPPSDQLDSLVTVLDLVRSRSARTRPEVTRLSGLGRNVVTQRVAQLTQYGLLTESGLGRSTGGRAPRELRLRGEAGLILVAALGATHIAAAVTDLSGRVLRQQVEPHAIAVGPEATLGRVAQLFDRLLAVASESDEVQVFGIGVGLPGPIEFASGKPANPPIMPGWDGYPVRTYLAERYAVPVWVDNEVNLMAQGEFRAGLAKGERDIIFVKLGTGIGAGLISSGRLHRGHLGCAGDIGHVAVAEGSGVICRCGNEGCLEALAGGTALARDARAAAEAGRSPYLAHVLESGANVEAVDVGRAAQNGDGAAVELIVRSGRLIGETLATLVNFFNPSLLILGGGVANLGDLLLAAIRETVYRRSAPLATRELRITRSPLDREAGLLGGAFMVIDELFSRERLGLWLADGSPVGHPDIAETPAAFASVGS